MESHLDVITNAARHFYISLVLMLINILCVVQFTHSGKETLLNFGNYIKT